MNTNPQISIVMPAYNAEKYIATTIESVLSQTFLEYELLVINDFSNDNTAHVVQHYCIRDNRVRLINLPQNKGAPAAPRNIGIQMAKGKWVAFLDSDDIWHPKKLERQIDLLERTGARFCSTQMVDFVSDSTLELKDALPDEYTWISFAQQLIRNRTPTSSVIVEKALIQRNLFNEDVGFKAREDLDCWLHCHEEIGRSVKIMAPMMGYRVIFGQISGNKLLMMRRHFNVLKQYKFRSGRRLGMFALVFTLSHIVAAFYQRKIKKRM